MKEIKDKHHQALNAYYEYTREAKLIRDARQKAEYEAGELERKRERAAERIEIASEPAFASEIITCESLIAYFDPSSAEAARKAKQTAAPRELAAKATREVKPVDGKLLVKKEEVYFIGTGGKKKGKMPRGAASPALAAAAASTEAPSTKALHINVGLLEELSKVNAPTPTGPDDVPRVLEYLRKQLKYYKDNQDRVTKEVRCPPPPRSVCAANKTHRTSPRLRRRSTRSRGRRPPRQAIVDPPPPSSRRRLQRSRPLLPR